MMTNPCYVSIRENGIDEYIGLYYETEDGLIFNVVAVKDDEEECKRRANILIEQYFTNHPTGASK